MEQMTMVYRPDILMFPKIRFQTGKDRKPARTDCYDYVKSRSKILKNQNPPTHSSIKSDNECYKCFRVVTEAPLLVKLDGHRLGTFNFTN